MAACFEVSFEICNKVGGIYTVLLSKSKYMKDYYGDDYYAVGFYDEVKSKSEFKEEPLPEKLNEVKDYFESQGIILHYGRWIKGSDVKTFLIDSRVFETNRINDIKKELWDLYKIDSLNAPYDFNTPVAWAYACGMLIEKIMQLLYNSDSKFVVQAHEWLSGACILYLKAKGFDKGLVFTSHATVLGRAYASHLNPLVPDNADINQLVYELKIESKHFVELQSAKNSNVFTTVSETTAKEAEVILGRKPDVLTYNALDFSKIPALYSLTSMQSINRKKINDFLKLYFLPYYQIDINNTFLVMTSGRNEFMGKGIDLYIDSLVELNKYLQKTKSSKVVIAFIFVPSDVGERNEEIRMNYNMFHFIEEQVEAKMDSVQADLIDSVVFSKNARDYVFKDDLVNSMEILSKKFKTGRGKPPVSAFTLKSKDDIIRKLEDAGLDNKEEDKVKIVYYPAYIKRDDVLIEMDYPEIVNSCDMAIFPSRYEPWGYTPIEAAANLTISITSNLSGCGKYILENFKDSKSVIVVNINKDTPSKIKDLIIENMFLNDKELLIRKVKAREISESLDWKVQIKNYLKAHKLAMK